MEKKNNGKMTLEKLAIMTQEDFLAIRKDMATKEDLRAFATKEDLNLMKEEIVAEVKTGNQKVIQDNDKGATKLDGLIKEQAAHKLAHDRMEARLENHEKRLKRVEETVTVADRAGDLRQGAMLSAERRRYFV